MAWASKIAYAVALKKKNETIEDEAWQQKAGYNTHINPEELNAAVKGVNLAMKCNPRDIAIMTNSVAVYSRSRQLVFNIVRKNLASPFDNINEQNLNQFSRHWLSATLCL